ncbi:MAG: Lacal_2735 family protein [Flavobacteriales bacterium]
MLNWFKKDPVDKLRKEKEKCLAEAHRLSTIDRKKSDEMTAKAVQIEQQILDLQKEGQA